MLPNFTTLVIHHWINQQFVEDLEAYLETQRQVSPDGD